MTIEDLAFEICSSRESDRVGQRVCIELVRSERNSEEETHDFVISKGLTCELRSC